MCTCTVHGLDQITAALSAAGADNLGAFRRITVGSKSHEWPSNGIAEGTDLRADAPNKLIGMERCRSKLRECTKTFGNSSREQVIMKLKKKHVCQIRNHVNAASEAVKLLERREMGCL